MKNFYKDLEQLTYYVYHESKYTIPDGWSSVKVYKNSKNGFYAEAFENKVGEKVLVFRGTDTEKGLKELIKDTNADLRLGMSKMPQQAYDAYLAYEDFASKNDNVTVAGYSLGGSLAQIVCGETGADGVTYAAYGVGDFITPKYTDNIINFGNESDPIYNININNHIGQIYVLPDDRPLVYKGTSFLKHMPNQIGDLDKSYQYKTNKLPFTNLKRCRISDNLLTPSNRIFHSNEIKFKDADDETSKEYVNQFYDNNYKMPKKEDLDRRVRFGELIYVNGYVRSDGTKVTGYYRSYLQK